MDTRHARHGASRTLGGTGSHPFRHPTLGMAVAIALLLQLVMPALAFLPIRSASAAGPATFFYVLNPGNAGPLTNVEWRRYENTTCTEPADLYGFSTLSSNYQDFGYRFNDPLRATSVQSIAVTAPPVANNGYTFSGWKLISTGEVRTNPTLCLPGADDGSLPTWQANYLVSATAMTAPESITGVVNSTVALSATLRTTAGTPVGGKTISFTLNGVTKTATTNGTTGVATLSGANLMPLTGLASGTSHTFTASFAGDLNYSGSSTSGTVRIGQAATLNWGVDRLTYDGTPKERPVTTTPAGLTGVTVTYTGTSVVYPASTTPPTQAGNYSVVASLSNPDYAAPNITGSFFILKAPQTITFTSTPPSPAQYGDSYTPTATGGGSGNPVVFSLAAGSACTLASGVVTFTGATGNCTIQADQALSSNYLAAPRVTQVIALNKRTVSGSFTAADKQYDGTTDAAILDRALVGAIGGDDVTLAGGTATFDDANPGVDKTVTGTGFALAGAAASKYLLASTTLTTTASITPRTTTSVIITPDSGQGKVYGDSDPVLTFTNDAGLGPEAFTGALSRVPGEDVGTYAITLGTLVVVGDYTLVLADPAATFAVTPKSVTVTPDSGQSKVAGTADPASLTYTLSENVPVTGALERAAGEDPGLYPIGLGTLQTTSSNHQLVLSDTIVNFEITGMVVTITPDSGQQKVYGAADPVLTFTNNAGLNASDFTGALARTAGEDVGDYPITLGSLSANGYTLVLADPVVTFAVTPRAITVTASPKTKVYGQPDPALTYTITSGSLAFSDTLTGSLSRSAGENTGTYAIEQGSLTGGQNYDLTFVGANLTITKAALKVMANLITVAYGDTPVYSSTYSGFAFNDGPSDLGGQLNCVAKDGNGNTVTSAFGVGSYTITCSGLTSDNYTITYVGAKLTIARRAITVTADAKTKTFGDADPPLTYTITSGSLVGSDTLIGSLTRAAGENAGSYAIKQGSLTAGGNYALRFVGAKLTIAKIALTIVADAKTKVYGEADPPLTYQITSGALIGSDTLSGALNRASGERAGAFAIRVGTLTAGPNYAITFVGAKLTITKRVLTIAADPKTKVYGTSDPPLTYQLTDGTLIGLDKITGSLVRVKGEAVGSYPIRQGTLTAGTNYAIIFVGATFAITPVGGNLTSN